jgi:hypothetical protein
MRTRYLLGISWLLAALLSGCGGGGGGGDGTNSNPANIGWVDVSSSHISLAADGTPVAFVNGSAFVSRNYVGHRQFGLCLLLCAFDDSEPGVKVSWENTTLATAGTATSRFGTLTQWSHLWSASIPLVAGSNTIRIAASDPAGNTGTATLTLVYSPLPPQKIAADTGDGKVTLIWDNVFGALSYNIYWSAVPGVTNSTGSLISNAASPYTLNGLTNGTTYYFMLTTISSVGESAASTQLSATAGAPPRPTGATAQAAGGDISVSWNPVPGATSFNLYWSNQTGVTKATGTRIAGVTSPFLHTGLTGIPYFYVVTAQNGIGESLESVEMTAMPQLPPPAPLNISLAQDFRAVLIQWTPVPGVAQYSLNRCDAWSFGTVPPTPANCRTFPVKVYVGSEAHFQDFGVVVGQSYRYHVTSINAFGSSAPSADAGIFVAP